MSTYLLTLVIMLFINTLCIIGIYEAAAQPKRILYPIKTYLEAKLPYKVFAPILGCVYCMASVWGTLFLAMSIFLEILPLKWGIVLPFYIAALSGLIHGIEFLREKFS
ncbi:hypothetical protein [uncultured Microscilla sp.]|uniref:hypothetical protein n=1 Tax=uncultured Microscilla sp. TaxID=432653 RepID=UPI00262033C1|nr:hypothetical protein [uncultured Microscilla sp.]